MTTSKRLAAHREAARSAAACLPGDDEDETAHEERDADDK